MQIEDMTDKQLQLEYLRLHNLIEVVRCFSAIDARRYDLIGQQLEKIGYEIVRGEPTFIKKGGTTPMTAKQKVTDEIAEDKAAKIYNALCNYYNANEIRVPTLLYNMILSHVLDAVEETSNVYRKESQPVN